MIQIIFMFFKYRNVWKKQTLVIIEVNDIII
jgi:hypothetical protein